MHILIVNQHGENRGDEAAMQGMLSALRDKYAGARFTLLYQYRDPNYLPPVDDDVRCLPIIMPIGDALGLCAVAFSRALGLRGDWWPLPSIARGIREAYETCDFVLSAPGGPYFGDLYANHEIVHIFLIWLGKLYGKPLFLFAPSCGPFRNRVLNPFRKRLFGWFQDLSVREAISAEYLRRFAGRMPRITADSAFLSKLASPEVSRDQVLTVTVLQHRAWLKDGSDKQAAYERAVVEAVEAVARRHNLAVVFLPQLCGNVHSDFGYLEAIGKRLGSDVQWRVFDREATADDQRRLIGRSILSIATRYHHQVFSISACTPVVAICYEHKSTGLMEGAGLDAYSVAIASADAQAIVQKCEAALRTQRDIQRQLSFERVRFRRRALGTVRMLPASVSRR